MREKLRKANFEHVLEELRANGFAIAPYADVEEGVLVSKAGVGAVLAPTDGLPRLVVSAGKLLGGEVGRLTDRGYQKFLRFSQGELPATAQDLHVLHQFSQELKQFTGAESLYNESIGTTSDRYQYDRVKGRELTEEGCPGAA